LIAFHPFFLFEYAGTAKSPWGTTSAGFTASTTINRKDWNLVWNVALETGGLLVGEEVKINIELEVFAGTISQFSYLFCWLTTMLNFALLRSKQITLEELCIGLTPADLHRLTDEMIDTMLGLLAEATDADVIFQPIDPNADDQFAANPEDANLAWTLGHVIVHATASGEETASQAADLARGVTVTWRARYETPWQSVSTIAELRQRMEESRRIRHAYLNAWPDEPHCDTFYIPPEYPNAKPRNAIQRFIAGLAHDDSHLEQISEILRQSRQARSELEVK
jgi:hypothetical protein